MAVFRYIALQANGKKTAGYLNADSLEVANELLRKKNLFVTKITSAQRSVPKQKGKNHLLAFTRDLSSLLQSGLPLYECLVAIEERLKNSPIQPVVVDLCDQIKAGRPFSKAIKKYPELFDDIYVALVSSGEETGTLDESFQQLTLFLMQQQMVKKKILSAITYPAFLLSFCLIVLGLLFFFLIPSLEELLLDRPLNGITITTIAISKFLRNNISLLTILFFSFVFSLFVGFKIKSFRYQMQMIFLRLPYIQGIYRLFVLVRFSQLASSLLKGGIPTLQMIRLSKDVMHEEFAIEVLKRIERTLLEGKPLSEATESESFFPILFKRMVAVGEESGSLSKMMENVYRIYEEELSAKIARLTTFLPPIMLLFVGLVVGIVLVAVLLPLTDMSSMMQF